MGRFLACQSTFTASKPELGKSAGSNHCSLKWTNCCRQSVAWWIVDNVYIICSRLKDQIIGDMRIYVYRFPGIARSFVGGECQCGAAPFPTASAATLQLWRDIDRFKGRIALGFDPQQCRCSAVLGGGFKYFYVCPIWGNDPIWQIFFRWVETTNCGFVSFCEQFAISIKLTWRRGVVRGIPPSCWWLKLVKHMNCPDVCEFGKGGDRT